MDELGNKVCDLLKELDSLWINNGDINENRFNKLSEDILNPIYKQIKDAKELKGNLLKQIKEYKEKATLQSYSLAIPLSLCQPSDSLNLQEQLDEWKFLVESFIDKIQDRNNEIKELKSELEVLCIELDNTIDNMYPDIDKKIEIQIENKEIIYVDDLSSERIEKYKNNIINVKNEIMELKNKINGLKNEIKELWEELQFTQEKKLKNPVDRFVDTNEYHYYSEKKKKQFSLLLTIKLLEKRKSDLLVMYQRLYGAVKELLPKICTLWKELKVNSKDKHRIKLWYTILNKHASIEEQKQFLQSLKDPKSKQKFPMNIIEACEKEYDRLMDMKTEIMKKLILNERKTLFSLWDKLHFSEEQRNNFECGFNEIYTQETLDTIINEINRLKELLQNMSHLLKQVERREWIKSEMKRFEKSASDPNRFKGSSTRLLEEEKFRKLVAKEFPRLTSSLRKTLVQWEKQHGGQAFYYEGEPYIDTMNKEEDNPNFELLHLRLLTSKSTKHSMDIQGPTIKSVADRKTKPVPQSQPRLPRPTKLNDNIPKTEKPKTSNRTKLVSETSTPLRSTKPRK